MCITNVYGQCTGPTWCCWGPTSCSGTWTSKVPMDWWNFRFHATWSRLGSLSMWNMCKYVLIIFMSFMFPQTFISNIQWIMHLISQRMQNFSIGQSSTICQCKSSLVTVSQLRYSPLDPIKALGQPYKALMLRRPSSHKKVARDKHLPRREDILWTMKKGLLMLWSQ